MIRLLLLIPVVSLLATGCAHTPTWSNANAHQRAAGDFTEDDAYLASPECEAQVQASADVIIRLSHAKTHSYE